MDRRRSYEGEGEDQDDIDMDDDDDERERGTRRSHSSFSQLSDVRSTTSSSGPEDGHSPGSTGSHAPGAR